MATSLTPAPASAGRRRPARAAPRPASSVAAGSATARASVTRRVVHVRSSHDRGRPDGELRRVQHEHLVDRAADPPHARAAARRARRRPPTGSGPASTAPAVTDGASPNTNVGAGRVADVVAGRDGGEAVQRVVVDDDHPPAERPHRRGHLALDGAEPDDGDGRAGQPPVREPQHGAQPPVGLARWGRAAGRRPSGRRRRPASGRTTSSAGRSATTSAPHDASTSRRPSQSPRPRGRRGGPGARRPRRRRGAAWRRRRGAARRATVPARVAHSRPASMIRCRNWRVRTSRRVAEQLLGRSLLDDAAGVEEADAVGRVAGEAHLVGDDEHRHAGLAEVADHRQHAADELGVERRGHLVEQQHVGVRRHRPHDRDPLLLAAGQPVRVRVGERRHPEQLEQPAGVRLGGRRISTLCTLRGASVMLSSTVMCGNRL